MISERAKRAGLKELMIFDNFETDNNLPKFTQQIRTEGITVSGNSVWFNATVPSNEGWMVDGSPSSGEKMRNWLIRLLEGKKKPKVIKKQISVLEFFSGLSKSYEELTPIADIATHYEKALVQAQANGQTALVEKLKDMVELVRSESHLIAMGLKKYVTEKQVYDFYEKVGEDKNLKLTWIKNFGRIIPEEIYQAKKDVDERKIFDNYVILHYDPANNGEKLTKKEIEKKKDPILFGVMKGSRKLYYIADWKDEYCELTLEDMFRELGEKVLKINNKSVKTFVDKVVV